MTLVRLILFSTLLFLFGQGVSLVFAQGVAIGDNVSSPDPKAILDLQSSTKGLLIPRLTTLQRSDIASPPEGLTVYDITEHSYFFWNGTQWSELTSSASALWTSSSGNTIQTNTAHVGIGETLPQARLDVKDIAVIGDISVGTESTLQEGSALKNKGFTTTPWLYTHAIQGAHDRNDGGALITLGKDDQFGNTNEIHFITDGEERLSIHSDGSIEIEEKVTIEDTLTADYFQYASPQQRKQAISPAAWKMDTPQQLLDFTNYTAAIPSTFSGNLRMVAPLNLPDNATLLGIEWNIINESAQDMQLNCIAASNGTGGNRPTFDPIMAQAGDGFQSIVQKNNTIFPRHTTNLEDSNLWLVAEGNGNFVSGDIEIKGIVVYYEIQQPN